MKSIEPEYSKGELFRNNITDGRVKIVDCTFDKDRCQIMYKMQMLRYRFAMFKLSQASLENNIEYGDYEVLEE
jgi:hypothetical protein